MLGILFGDNQWLCISRSELLETGYIEIQSSEHIFAKSVAAVKKKISFFTLKNLASLCLGNVVSWQRANEMS